VILLQPFYVFWKIVTDTLQVNGKWAHKRVLAFVSFHIGAVYAFVPFIRPDFEVKEFVVMCFFGLSAGCLGIDLQQQIKMNQNDNETKIIDSQLEQNNPLL